MGNTFFYRDVKNNPNKITLKEILSECRIKHSKRDLEYQLSAGTAINQATEQDMLQKWKKPWIFYRMMIGGFAIITFLFILYAIMLKTKFMSPAIFLLSLSVPPIVVPLTITVFMWELNIPRNISIYEVVLGFIVGGISSLFIGIIISEFLPDTLNADPKWAPVSEEPAKLITALILLVIIAKKKKIYGLSGVVVGAAVGAGFSAFESIYYMFKYIVAWQDVFAANGIYANFWDVFHMEGMAGDVFKAFLTSRFIGGFAGHTTWCAGYTGAIALHMKNSKLSGESFMNSDFILAFVGAFITHYINNSDEIWNALGIKSDLGAVIFEIVLSIVEWFILLYILRRCLYQAVSLGRYQSGDGMGYTQAVGAMNSGAAYAQAQMAAAASVAKITVVCISGAIKGAVWQSTGANALTIGREEGNVFKIPQNVQGISRQHCIIRYTATGWIVKDLNSTYGTLVNHVRLAPGAEQPLREGDVIYLAGDNQAFRVTYQA